MGDELSACPLRTMSITDERWAYAERRSQPPICALWDAILIATGGPTAPRWSEIDLIARDGDALVIVEVKTRRSLAFGTPVEAVTRLKIRQLRSLALAWLDERSIHAPAMRFDLVAVTIPPAGQPVVEHLRAV